MALQTQAAHIEVIGRYVGRGLDESSDVHVFVKDVKLVEL